MKKTKKQKNTFSLAYCQYWLFASYYAVSAFQVSEYTSFATSITYK